MIKINHGIKYSKDKCYVKVLDILKFKIKYEKDKTREQINTSFFIELPPRVNGPSTSLN